MIELQEGQYVMLLGVVGEDRLVTWRKAYMFAKKEELVKILEEIDAADHGDAKELVTAVARVSIAAAKFTDGTVKEPEAAYILPGKIEFDVNETRH